MLSLMDQPRLIIIINAVVIDDLSNPFIYFFYFSSFIHGNMRISSHRLLVFSGLYVFHKEGNSQVSKEPNRKCTYIYIILS